MLTIGRLAEYVGVTTRAIRHYHALGLLPEPERNASGYRSYGAQDVIELQRIKVLTDAGVPLARVRELVDAGPDALRAAIAEIDGGLRARIRDLQRTRRSLAALAEGGEPSLPAKVVEMHERLSSLGVTERTLALERDAWVLVQVLFPHLIDPWVDTQAAMLDDPGYRDVYLQTDLAYDWEPDDPRIEEVAQRTMDWVLAYVPPPDPVGWDADATAQRLVRDYRRDSSPGWRRLMERVEELAEEADYGPKAPDPS